MNVPGRHLEAEMLPEVLALLRLARGNAEFRFHAERLWAATSFAGVRHTVGLEFNGGEATAAAELFLERVRAADFALDGKQVIEAKAIWVARSRAPRTEVVVELLTLEKY